MFTTGCYHHPWLTTPGSQPLQGSLLAPASVPLPQALLSTESGVLAHLCQKLPAAHSRQGTHPGPQDILVGGCYCRLSWSPPLSPFHLRPAHWLLLASSQTYNLKLITLRLLPQGLCTGSSPSLGSSFLSFFKGCCLLPITNWHLLRALPTSEQQKHLPSASRETEPMSQFFASGGQSIGVSASVLPLTIHD